ncbi:DUF3168 domain-containing protein [Bacteroides neonati]|uniref:DUF3168 domain-containing protein n=1 Tax=Bacteroides neonati TaxID=1347393 RepID=UPI0004B13A25|nr:DUF3168 domain-containing protein [Bacteroides neonati]
MSLQIGKAIYELLSGNTDIAAKISNKIFPLIATNNTSFPFIIYKRTNIIPAYTKDRFSANDTLMMDVVIASDKYNEAIELADLVRNTLEGKRGTFATIQVDDIRLVSADEDYNEDTYIQQLTFKIITNGN